MTKQKSTKRALLMSALSLLLCVSMLIGTTYAWFTDSVTSTGNKIVAGTLEVDLLMANASGVYASIADQDAAIFGADSLYAQNNAADTLWEPGKTQIVYLGVENKGNLDLKYNILLNVTDGGLVGALEYAILDGAKYGDVPAGSTWETVKANAQVGNVTAGSFTAAPNGAIKANEDIEYFALAIHMKEEAGNEYMGEDITIDLTLVATQLASEEDSFGIEYDKNATYPAVKVENIENNTTKDTVLVAGDVAVEIPAGSAGGRYELVVSNKNSETENSETTVSYDISLLLDGEKAPAGTYEVSIYVGEDLNLAGITHNGVAIEDFDYENGIVTFTTTHFSPFAVTYYESKIESDDNAAQLIEKGGNFTLQDDVVLTEAIVIPEGAEVLLDLNGKTISNETGYVIENMGTLKITGNGTMSGLGCIRSKAGTITIENGNFYASSQWQNGDYQHTLKAENTEVVIRDGNFDATVKGQTNAVFNASTGGTITINGGTFKNVSGDLGAFDPYLFTYENDGKVIINDGSFTGGWRFNGTTATTVINGGKFTVGYDGQSFNASSTHTLTIYGGTFYEQANAKLTAELEKFVAEGYVAKDNGDGTHLVKTGPVAKVGNTEYDTIDEAIANWKNNTTLTLLKDVTLSDVITLSSTEYHTLDLGVYTMTAASKKDAIQIANNGRSSASYALDIKADATNPGGITATGKAVVRHSGSAKDRPITRFYGGVFHATYIVNHSGNNGANSPSFYFYGGEFNGTIYTYRSTNIFEGGTFNGSLQMSVDSSAYTLIKGGTFKQLSNLMGSDLTTGNKFTIGSSKGANDGSVCIDENGYYVITKTTPTNAEASVASKYNSSNYFYYSTVNTNGMYYEDVYMALEKNKTATVTVFTDTLDLTGISFTGTIVVPEGNSLTITNAPAGLKTEGNATVTYR